MSKPTIKGNTLPSLQKLIVLHLAETEPQTMNETAKAISKHYRPSHYSFKSLEKKKLVKKTRLKKYHRTQKYPRYWLTDKGIIMALLEGASPDKLLKQAKRLYPKAEAAHAFLEIAPSFHPEVVKMAYSSVMGKGKIGVAEVILLYLSQPAIALDAELAKKITAALKKYPDEYSKLKTAVEEMINRLNQLITE